MNSSKSACFYYLFSFTSPLQGYFTQMDQSVGEAKTGDENRRTEKKDLAQPKAGIGFVYDPNAMGHIHFYHVTRKDGSLMSHGGCKGMTMCK